MEWNKKTIRTIFLGVVGCIFLYWLLHETERIMSLLGAFWGMISPFVVGAAIAFVLNVPMRSIEKLFKKIPKPGIRRALAVLCTIIAVMLVLAGVIYLLIPQVAKTVENLISTLTGFFSKVQHLATEYLKDHPELMTWLMENTDLAAINWSDLIQKAVSLITNSISAIMEKAVNTAVNLGVGVFDGVLSVVFAIYCLSRKEILARQGRRLLYSLFPEKFCDETIRILRMTNTTFSNFISGQCLEAIILGIMFAISMSIFRMPYMPLVSVIIAVTALVPIVGAFAGCALGAFFILVDDPMLALWFIVMFLILQQIEGNMIYPRVVGTSIGLPGMWVLVAVAVGGDLMGVGGMLLMIPLASVLYALAREFTDKRLSSRGISAYKLQDQPPVLRSGFKQRQINLREKKRKAKKAKEKQQAEQENQE